jgi:hypothetical protein
MRLRSRSGVFGSRQTAGKCEDALSGFVIDRESVGGALPVVLFSSFTEGAQLGVPVGFEGVGDESVRGRHMHVALTRELDFALRALDLSMTQAIGFVETTLDLLVHGERHLERDGRDGLDEERGDGIVDRSADDALAKRISEFSPASGGRFTKADAQRSARSQGRAR